MKVFISYSLGDSDLAAELTSELQEAGFDVFNSEDAMLPGDNSALELGKALERSDAMVVLVSKESMKSPWVRQEINYALGSKRYADRLIPVLLDDRADIPWILHELHPIRPDNGRKGLGRHIIEQLRRVTT